MTRTAHATVNDRESLSPETVRDLERGCAELFNAYRRGMAYAEKVDSDMREMFGPLCNTSAGPDSLVKLRKLRDRVRNRANVYRRRGETILAVLEWAAPDKERERRLRYGAKPLSVDYREEQRLITS